MTLRQVFHAIGRWTRVLITAVAIAVATLFIASLIRFYFTEPYQLQEVLSYRLEHPRAEHELLAQDDKRRITDLLALRKPKVDNECRRVLRSRGVILPENTACILVDDVINNLPSAMYQFNKPEVAYVEEPFRVVMVLPTAPEQDTVTPFQSTAGEIVKKKAKFAQYMEAMLRGDVDLKVSPTGPQPRTITSLEPTIWEWTIIPQKAGDKTLVIDVTAQLVVGAQKDRVQLRTIHEDIHVEVRLSHQVLAFFSSLHGLLLSLATLAIGGLGVLHFIKPKKADEIRGAELLTHQLHDKSHSDTQPH